MKKTYYSFLQDEKEAQIYIYGDITSWPWYETDVSSYTLAQQLSTLGEVETIHVYINSYGGEVAEGLAIYNALKRHKAKVITYVDGFACSIASVIFAAGDERIVSNSSLLMIHDAWTWAAGNAEELRKAAGDLDIITQAAVNAYLEIVNITEKEVNKLMDAESWIPPQDALAKGFATSIVNNTASNKVSQSSRMEIFNLLMGMRKNVPTNETPKEEASPEPRQEEVKNVPMQFMGALFRI